MTDTRPILAVYGSSVVRPGDAAYQLALELGREAARAGADVMTGGYHGAMEACSRGAHEAGGHVIGVTVELFEARGPVNAFVRERVHTADLYERLRHLVDRADGFIVLPGSIGTLNELFLTWTLVAVGGRRDAPIVLLGAHWQAFVAALRHPDMVVPHLFEYLRITEHPAEAVRLALGKRAPTRATETA
jgi:uncharacterized protein (TIGR00730 family)